MERIKYTCKKCGWSTSIIAAWGDLKPTSCLNRKCRTHFKLKPDMLLIEVPSYEKEDSKEEWSGVGEERTFPEG